MKGMKVMGNLHLFGYGSQPYWGLFCWATEYCTLGNYISFGQLYFCGQLYVVMYVYSPFTVVLWATLYSLYNSSPFTTQPAKPRKKRYSKFKPNQKQK